MQITLFGIVVEAYRKNSDMSFTPKNVDSLARRDFTYPNSKKIARIKASRTLNRGMGLWEAKAWVEQNFPDNGNG